MDTLHLGIKFAGHDSCIFAIFPSEKDIFGIATERLTRYKHDNLYPIPAIKKVLSYKNIDPKKIKKVFVSNCFALQKDEYFLSKRYEIQLAERKHFKAKFKNDLKDRLEKYSQLNHLQKFVNLISSISGLFKLGITIKGKIVGNKTEKVDNIIKRVFQKIFPNAEIIISHYDHELCHAVSSYYTSPFEKAILFTYDGWGDGDFSKVYIADNGKLELKTRSLYSPIDLSNDAKKYTTGYSIGGIYTYFTEMLGFQPESDEGKVEALAAYGNWNNEIYYNLMKLARINEAELSIDMDKMAAEKYLNYNHIKKLLESIKKEDVAAAVQKFLENITLPYLKLIINKIKLKNLCLSGGVTANVIMNLRIFEEVTDKLHIVPAMADDGAAQGAAILQLLDNGYNYNDLAWLKDRIMPYYGTSYGKKEILDYLHNKENLVIEDWADQWPEKTAELVAQGKIGAIFQGKMEWGPRALGNRSIIADPRRPEFRELINKEIKKRPLFQPFCPSILAEEKDRLFENAYLNKHMTCAFKMKKEFWNILPGAVHIDGTARVQFVEEADNPLYFRLLKKIKELTGYGIVINTSFNKHGRTIVESPKDAVTDFLDTDMDYLIIEGYCITRK